MNKLEVLSVGFSGVGLGITLMVLIDFIAVEYKYEPPLFPVGWVKIIAGVLTILSFIPGLIYIFKYRKKGGKGNENL